MDHPETDRDCAINLSTNQEQPPIAIIEDDSDHEDDELLRQTRKHQQRPQSSSNVSFLNEKKTHFMYPNLSNLTTAA